MDPSEDLAALPPPKPPPPPKPTAWQEPLRLIPSPEQEERESEGNSTRRLLRELESVRQEIRALEEMLDSLPEILERKYRQRLEGVLRDQKRLIGENQGLRKHLAALNPSGGAPATPNRLLPPAPEGAGQLDLLREALSDGAPTRSGWEGPTHR